MDVLQLWLHLGVFLSIKQPAFFTLDLQLAICLNAQADKFEKCSFAGRSNDESSGHQARLTTVVGVAMSVAPHPEVISKISSVNPGNHAIDTDIMTHFRYVASFTKNVMPIYSKV
ncbi:hypothetical protein Btru_029144 [Bulinus truncatus]|nr:hypothetical protein Btru_029144 [Bulinus truncatus]